jgi:hypothetical protein
MRLKVSLMLDLALAESALSALDDTLPRSLAFTLRASMLTVVDFLGRSTCPCGISLSEVIWTGFVVALKSFFGSLDASRAASVQFNKSVDLVNYCPSRWQRIEC